MQRIATAPSPDRPAERLHGRDGRRMPDYERWSIEELRAFARQLQVPGSMYKNRGELIEILGCGRREAV